MPGIPPARSPSWVVALPAAVGLGLAIAVAGLFVATHIRRPARGPRLRIDVSSECPRGWGELLATRAEMVGLGEPVVEVDGRHTLVDATMPGAGDDIDAIPDLLTSPGAVELREPGGGKVLATRTDLGGASFAMDFRGHPYVELELAAAAAARIAAAGGRVDVLLDGRQLVHGAAVDGRVLRLQPELGTLEAELRAATDWRIVLESGSAPCPAAAVQVSAPGGA